MEALTEEGTPIELSVFEELCTAFYGCDENAEAARNIINGINERSDAWLLMHGILTTTKQDRTISIALNIFKNGVVKSWNLLSDEDKEAMKAFFFRFVIDAAQTNHSIVVTPANAVLIEILKNEWPFNWRNFTLALINESKQNEDVCCNNLILIGTLSDEVHETRDQNLTSDRLLELDAALDNDFSLIFTHIEEVMAQTESEKLRRQALDTLSHFLFWVDLRLITASTLCQQMVTELLPMPAYRAPVLKCFASIANHRDSIAESNMTLIFELLTQNLTPILGSPEEIEEFCSDLDDAHALVEALTSFLLLDSSGLLQTANPDAVHISLFWMANLVAFTEGPTFQECIAMWHHLARQFITDRHKFSPQQEILTPLKYIICQAMRRPIAFTLIMTQDNEFVLAEQNFANSDEAEFYKTISQTLLFLCRLGPPIFDFLLEKIGQDFTYDTLPFYYSIGSIAGAYKKDDEEKFINQVLGHLNSLTSGSMETPEEILLAGCFCYISASYIHILKNNREILYQVINKIFEISGLQTVPALQVMAVQCLSDIGKKSGDNLIVPQGLGKPSLLEEWLGNMAQFISVFPYEALPPLFEMLAVLIKRVQVQTKRNEMISTLFQSPIEALSSALESLSSEAAEDGNFALRITVPLDALGRVVEISDDSFRAGIEEVIGKCVELLDFYTSEIGTKGDLLALVRVKNQILKLFQAYLSSFSITEFTGELITKIIEDYNALDFPLRTSQSLDTLRDFLKAQKGEAAPFVDAFLTNVIVPTNEVLASTDISDFPDLRSSYYSLLSVMMTDIFDSPQAFDSSLFNEMMNSMFEGILNPQQAICETSLSCIMSIVTLVDGTGDEEFIKAFYSAFLMPIIYRLIEVLTDTSHKFVFSNICQVLFHLMQLCWQDRIRLDIEEDPRVFVSQNMCDKLLELFPTLNGEETLNFSQTLVNEQDSLVHFKENLGNFLINLRKASPKEAQTYKDEDSAIQINELDGMPMDEDGGEFFDEGAGLTEF